MRRQRTTRLCSSAGGQLQSIFYWQRAAQWLALDVLYDQVIRTDVVQRADVRMIQRRNGPSFALEALAVRGFEDLDGDDAVEARIARDRPRPFLRRRERQRS